MSRDEPDPLPQFPRQKAESFYQSMQSGKRSSLYEGASPMSTNTPFNRHSETCSVHTKNYCTNTLTPITQHRHRRKPTTEERFSSTVASISPLSELDKQKLAKMYGIGPASHSSPSQKKELDEFDEFMKNSDSDRLMPPADDSDNHFDSFSAQKDRGYDGDDPYDDAYSESMLLSKHLQDNLRGTNGSDKNIFYN